MVKMTGRISAGINLVKKRETIKQKRVAQTGTTHAESRTITHVAGSGLSAAMVIGAMAVWVKADVDVDVFGLACGGWADRYDEHFLRSVCRWMQSSQSCAASIFEALVN